METTPQRGAVRSLRSVRVLLLEAIIGALLKREKSVQVVISLVTARGTHAVISMAFEFPVSVVLSSRPGYWPATDDYGCALKVTHNPLRSTISPHGKKKDILTKSNSSGIPVLLSGRVDAVLNFIIFLDRGMISAWRLFLDNYFDRFFLLDRSSMKSFLLGYLSYLSPRKLLEHVIEVVKQQQGTQKRLHRSHERRCVIQATQSLTFPPSGSRGSCVHGSGLSGSEIFERRALQHGFSPTLVQYSLWILPID